MSGLQFSASDFRQNTLAYINCLDRQSARVMDLAGELPIPITQQLELQHIWRLTRQKLDYFRRELERADARFRNELEQLHNALLPEIIACQVRLSNCILERFCLDSCFTEQWKAIWLNTERA